MIKAGDRLPSVPVKLVDAAGVTETDTLSILGKGTVVLFARARRLHADLRHRHLPGFVANADKLKAAGRRPHRLRHRQRPSRDQGLGRAQRRAGQGRFHRRPAAASSPMPLGWPRNFRICGHRYARFAMIVRDGVVDKLFVQDVAGVTVSGAPAILLALQGEAAA